MPARFPFSKYSPALALALPLAFLAGRLTGGGSSGPQAPPEAAAVSPTGESPAPWPQASKPAAFAEADAARRFSGDALQRVRLLLKSPTLHNDLPKLLNALGELSADEAQTVLRQSRTLVNEGLLPKNTGETVMLTALSRLAELDCARAVRELAGLNRMRDQGAAVIMERVASRDPQKAAALLPGEFSDMLGPKSQALASVLSSAWAAQDYSQALEWSLKQEGGLRDGALAGLVAAAFERDPQSALELYGRIGDGADRRRAERRLLHKWMEKDPAKALEFIREQGDDPGEERHRTLFKHWAESDLKGSLEGLERAAPGARRAAAENIMEVWAQSSPVEAAKWLEGQPEAVAGFSAVSELASAWGLQDPEAASLWVQGLPPGERREGAVFGLVNSQQDRDGASAVAWAERLEDAEMRRRSLSASFVRWRRENPEAAHSWLEKTERLTESQKAVLRPNR